MTTAAQYRRISKARLCGLAGATFFAATGFAGCSALFPPLLLITVPAALLAPVLIFFRYRRALSGPCPYCGAKGGPAVAAFDCRNCRKRILLSESAFVRAPQ